MRALDVSDLMVVANTIETLETVEEMLNEEGLSINELSIVTEDGEKFGRIYWDVNSESWKCAFHG